MSAPNPVAAIAAPIAAPVVASTRSFLDAESFVGKVAFLLLAVVVFMMLLRVGLAAITRVFGNNGTTHLVQGMVPGTHRLVFAQDGGPGTVQRSVNQTDGVEFTWSVWLFVNALQSQGTKFNHVFSKGNDEVGENGMVEPNNAPGVYLAPRTNALTIVMNTFRTIHEEITVDDLPLNKWVHVVIRCKNTTLDVYINGQVARSLELDGVPKQNYGHVNVAMNGGFDGYLSNLWYFNEALSPIDIQRLVRGGPNTTMVGSIDAITNDLTDYLSPLWYDH